MPLTSAGAATRKKTICTRPTAKASTSAALMASSRAPLTAPSIAVPFSTRRAAPSPLATIEMEVRSRGSLNSFAVA